MVNALVPVSESVIFIANISVIGISVISHIGAPTHHYCLQINILFSGPKSALAPQSLLQTT